MKKGDKLKCNNDITNIFGWILFEKGEIYNIIGIDDEEIYLNHVLYANEYNSYNREWVNKNFTPCQ